jgi:D-3-phosphoglycerate dehydrogenase
MTALERIDRDIRPLVLRLDLPLDPAFDNALRAAPDVRLCVLPPRGADDAVATALETAVAYHVSSAKDELPQRWHVRDALLEHAPRLLFVSSYGAGYDTVDVAACTKAGVCVMNQAGSNANAVAEHAIGLVLGLSKRIAECDRKLRAGEPFSRHAMIGFDLDGHTLGLVGIGHAGSRMAALGRAFGMSVLACDPFVAQDEIARRGAESVDLATLLARADVVSLHCPLDDGTRGLFDARAFAAMKPGALFISTARGGIHDEAALADALRRRHLGGAGLDVWTVEPPPAAHPLLALDTVIATHHIAGVTHQARRRMATMASGQILDALRGERPPRLVNPEAWPACAARLAALIKR